MRQINKPMSWVDAPRQIKSRCCRRMLIWGNIFWCGRSFRPILRFCRSAPAGLLCKWCYWVVKAPGGPGRGGIAYRVPGLVGIACHHLTYIVTLHSRYASAVHARRRRLDLCQAIFFIGISSTHDGSTVHPTNNVLICYLVLVLVGTAGLTD